MVHVIKNIRRPSAEIINGFSTLAAATIHEASGRKGYIDCAIKPIARGTRICGPAFTVQCMPGDNLMLHKALECAKPGDVIVASVGGAFDYGYFGNLMATSALARGVGGLCIDGCIRDSAEIIAGGFPIFARGFCIRGTNKATIGIINYPTVFGEQMVFPGDLIVGDDDGLVIVRFEECADVLEKARDRVAKEIDKEAVLRTGISSVEFNKLGPVMEKAGLVEEQG
jgi:4-hydroxy-4-methyl-2-oxoglutarate aldolase